MEARIKLRLEKKDKMWTGIILEKGQPTITVTNPDKIKVIEVLRSHLGKDLK